jgi:hypothetical protein
MADFKTITIIYDYERDETIIEASSDFCNLPKIHQLDALRDAIFELENLYNLKLKEFNKGPNKGESFYYTKNND